MSVTQNKTAVTIISPFYYKIKCERERKSLLAAIIIKAHYVVVNA